MSTIEELEQRIDRLRYQIRELMLFVDHERCPFVFYALAADLSKTQVNDIHKLMKQTAQNITAGHGPSVEGFESQMREVTGMESDARLIVESLYKTHQFEEVYKYFQEKGMTF